ncbi:MAG: flotillin-like protein FloA [Bacteroidia bacterium]
MEFILLNTSTVLITVFTMLTVLAVLAILWFIPVGLWITARVSGVRINFFQLIFMRLRRVDPKKVINEMIKAVQAGLKNDIEVKKMEAHYLAKGDITMVVNALIAARNANIPLDFKQAAAIDLAGRDVLQAVRDSVNPKVIDSPVIEAMSQDGIQLLVKARITVRAHIDKLVGGAGEETIVARVGQGIVQAVGSVNEHKNVLENPKRISEQILTDGLTAGTAFDVLSIDIADIDVGKNIGAKLKQEEAHADLKVAQAKAEEKRAEAVAEEQYFKARVQEMRAKLIDAESQVPLAISDAFRIGNLGIMDYHRLQNIEADTDMRRSFAEEDAPKQPEDGSSNNNSNTSEKSE